DFKKTLKVTWLADVSAPHPSTIPVVAVAYDHIISKLFGFMLAISALHCRVRLRGRLILISIPDGSAQPAKEEKKPVQPKKEKRKPKA
ncbi:hypothetical protein PRIPAC_92112, partial [Pristionchus pacificus]|uniref:Uncharacterized protein n=1 Tax=Pristionchus pacificus TaxID=54126 RepID=A0A2A6CDQ6_PRIPA